MAFKQDTVQVKMTRNTGTRPDVIQAAEWLMEPNAVITDAEGNPVLDAEGNSMPRLSIAVTAADDVLAPVGSKAWMESAQAEAGAVRSYVTKTYGEQLKARGLKCSTKKYDDENVVRVCLIPDPKLQTGEETVETEQPEQPTGEQAAA